MENKLKYSITFFLHTLKYLHLCSIKKLKLSLFEISLANSGLVRTKTFTITKWGSEYWAIGCRSAVLNMTATIYWTKTNHYSFEYFFKKPKTIIVHYA